MKKFIKNIIVGVFGLALVLLAQGVSANTSYGRGSVSWNGAPNDCKGISIINATTDEGYGDPCWYGTSISADAGDTINVRIYYHNTGSMTAENVKVVLNAPTGGSASTTKTFSGSISSNQGGISLGSVTAKLSSSQTITFDSVKWYTENTNVTLTPLLNGQSGSSILSGGLNIGSISASGDSQGSLVVKFKVSNNTTPEQEECKISKFLATNTNINQGDSTNLSWVTSGCDSVYISNVGEFGPTGNKTISPYTTTTYTLTAYGDAGQDSESLKITVNKVITEEMTGSISASPSSCIIPTGSSTCTSNLSWNTINPTGTSAVTKSGSTIASGNSGSKIVSLSNGASTYYLYNSSQLLDSVSVSASCDSNSTWTGSYCKENIINNNNCTISSFKATPSSIQKGDSSVLSWVTNNCTNVSVSGLGTYGIPFSGSELIWPSSTKTYTITAYGPAGGTQTRTTTVYVDEDDNSSQCKIDSFSASDTRIDEGDETELRWRTTGCDRVKISDIGTVDEDGEETVEPDEDTTYTLTAYDDNGNSVKDTVKIYVDEDDDDSDNDDDRCSIDSFTTSKSFIQRGDSVSVKWRTTDCDSVSITNLGNVSEDGSEVIYPYSTTSYVIRAYGDRNTETKNLKITVGTPSIGLNTSVITTVATNITQTGASLNGMLTSTNAGAQNVYFDYGTTVNLGRQTPLKTTSGNTNFSEYVSGLSPNTIYFFQAVSQGTEGVSRGAIEVFRTVAYAQNNSSTIISRQVTQGTTVYGSASPVMLEISNRYQALNRGDVMEYTVYYKNISRSTLSDPMIQVYIPKGITVTNVSAGTYSEDDRTLSVPIQDLRAGEEGEIYLQARVVSIDPNLAQVVTTAILVYTNPNQAQENAMAYVLNTPGSSVSSLGAAAFFGGFLGFGLIGWLIIIILILLIVLIAKSYYDKKPQPTEPSK